MNDLAKNVVLWVVIAVVLATVVSNFSSRGQTVQEMPYSAFLTHVKDGTVSQVTFSGDKISGLRSSGEQFVVFNPETDNSALIGTLQKSGITFSAAPPERQSFLMQLFISSFPILLLIGAVSLAGLIRGRSRSMAMVIAAGIIAWGLIVWLPFAITAARISSRMSRIASLNRRWLMRLMYFGTLVPAGHVWEHGASKSALHTQAGHFLSRMCASYSCRK